jgi:hypothetical protein
MKSWAAHNRAYEEDVVEDIYKRQGIKGVINLMLLENLVWRTISDPLSVARWYLLQGKKELALDWLEKSFESQFTYLPASMKGRSFESLKSEPRYTELLKKMGLTE